MINIKKTITLLAISSFIFIANAAENHNEHHNHANHLNKNDSIQSEYSKEYSIINDNMHKGMTFESTGNPDKDFVIGMIAHHKGAVEMAKVQLKYGSDENLINLSNEIISAQEKEIKLMEDWLKNN